jgi:hypothetical protein
LPPYCFIAEVADKVLPERLANIKPIDEEKVLLFPVVTEGIISGTPVYVGIGSPVLYKQGTDLETVSFSRVEKWPRKRYLVWARGYYPKSLSNLFVYTNEVFGKTCIVEELTPLKPGTDRTRMEKAIIDELRKGEITVEPRLEITDDIDYARVIRAESVLSWMESPIGSHKSKLVWGLPIGSKVKILLAPDDFRLIESYLRGDESGSKAIQSAPKP